MSTYAPFAKPLYVMLKPVGAVCNLACDYCYYLEKSEYPKIKPCFVELLCLLYAGFSPQQISVITNETLKTIYMRKFHLKKKIIASHITTKDVILNIIS